MPQKVWNRLSFNIPHKVRDMPQKVWNRLSFNIPHKVRDMPQKVWNRHMDFTYGEYLIKYFCLRYGKGELPSLREKCL
jgi:hypothetical protein